MNKAIIIGTYGGREDWAKDALASLNGYTRYPVITLNVPWELNVIRWCYENTNLSEFLFLQDTVVVKNTDWIDELFDHNGSVSLCGKPFYMYLGKYTRTALNICLMDHDWPEVINKRQAVTHEGDWTSWYDRAAHAVGDTKYLWHEWDQHDPNVFTGKHGRLNMLYENDHIIKYKGTWSPEMIPE